MSRRSDRARVNALVATRSDCFPGSVDPVRTGWYHLQHKEMGWSSPRGYCYFDGAAWWRPFTWDEPTDGFTRFVLGPRDAFTLLLGQNAVCSRVTPVMWHGLAEEVGVSNFGCTKAEGNCA